MAANVVPTEARVATKENSTYLPGRPVASATYTHERANAITHCDTHTDTDTDRHTHTHTHRETERQRKRETESHTHRGGGAGESAPEPGRARERERETSCRNFEAAWVQNGSRINRSPFCAHQQ